MANRAKPWSLDHEFGTRPRAFARTATAYPAATIFVTAVILQLNRQVLFRVSLALHLAFAVAIAAAPAFARQWPIFEQLQFLRSSLGWHDVAGAVRSKLAEDRYGAVLVHTRHMAAEMLYYLRDSDVPLYIWVPGAEPHSHFEMTRPFTASTPEPILFVSLKPCRQTILRSFDEASELAARMVHFCRLTGYRDNKRQAP